MRELVKRNLQLKQCGFRELFRPLRFFCLSMAALLLSICFPVAEAQFLVLSVISGIKWIADERASISIIIEERR